MHIAHVLISIATSVIITTTIVFSADSTHAFTFGQQEFLLDGKPFQMISGEIHPARVPQEYWRHRIQMAKAMGCNTIAAYIFWNYHEGEPGVWDFETGNRDLGQFLRLVQEEGMWALLRPGPPEEQEVIELLCNPRRHEFRFHGRSELRRQRL